MKRFSYVLLCLGAVSVLYLAVQPYLPGFLQLWQASVMWPPFIVGFLWVAWMFADDTNTNPHPTPHNLPVSTYANIGLLFMVSLYLLFMPTMPPTFQIFDEHTHPYINSALGWLVGFLISAGVWIGLRAYHKAPVAK